MKTTRTTRFTSYEPFTFTTGVRWAWVTWEIASDGWGFTRRSCVGVSETKPEVTR